MEKIPKYEFQLLSKDLKTTALCVSFWRSSCDSLDHGVLSAGAHALSEKLLLLMVENSVVSLWCNSMEYKPGLVRSSLWQLWVGFHGTAVLGDALGALPALIAQQRLVYRWLWGCSPVPGRSGGVSAGWHCHSGSQPPDGAAVWFISGFLAERHSFSPARSCEVSGGLPGTLVFLRR